MTGEATSQRADLATAARIESYLDRFQASAPLPGFSVVVVRDGRVLFSRGFGVEVAGEAQPMTSSSSVGIGSLTKSFTALAIMQLVDQGRLSLEDPVVKHLPWFRTADEEISRRITVRMLLSNTSGLPSIDGLWFGNLDTSDEAMERLARALSRYRTRREPGTSFEYSNEGWTVLGLLVQKLSGESYASYLERHVLEPLGMSRSTTRLDRFEELGVLHGHLSSVDGFSPAPPHYQAACIPAGSMMHASADDLGHYLIALLDGGAYGGKRIVAEEGLRALWSPVISFPGPSIEDGGTGAHLRYALGWMVDELDGRTVIHHSGATRTMSSETFLEPDTRTGVSILTNTDALDLYRWTPLRTLANNLLHLANGRPLSDFGVPRRKDPTLNSYELPSGLAARYEGSYLDSAGNRLDVSEHDGRLLGTLSLGGLESGVELDFSSPAAVVMRNVSGASRGAFSITPEGKVSAFTLEGFGAAGPYRRMAVRGDLVSTRSPDGTVTFPRPPEWSVQWSASRFEARPNNGTGMVLSGGWSSEPASAPANAIEHIETVAGRVWHEQVWTEEASGGSIQWMRLRTKVGTRDFEIVAMSPDGQLTGLLRDGVNGILRDLRFESGIAAGTR